MRFNNKKVVITGSTSGIGLETSMLFAREGANLILLGRNKEKGAELVNNILEIGGHACFIQCDITKENDVENFKDILMQMFEKIDVLYNNAGIMLPSTEIEKMPLDDWDRTFDTNIRGLFLVTRACKKLFRHGSCIINNASIAGLHYYAAGRSYAYSASKAAVIQLSHQMAKNYAEDGIRVNCICPGIIDTPILGDRDKSKYAKRVPLGYIGHPLEVAKVVAFLASDEASYITGAVLTVDGGVSL